MMLAEYSLAHQRGQLQRASFQEIKKGTIVFPGSGPSVLCEMQWPGSTPPLEVLRLTASLCQEFPA